MINIWNRHRENFKDYTDTPVPLELEEKLDAIVYACPLQTHGLEMVQIFKATDRTTKELLSKDRFKNNSYGWNEIAPIKAPLVYFCCQRKLSEYHDAMHSGIIGGAMMTECLNAGYDFSFIGCTEEVSEKQEKRINNHLRQIYDIDFDVWAPFLAFCVGIGKAGNHPMQYTLEDGTNINYLPLIYKPQKPKLLYKPSLSL